MTNPLAAALQNGTLRVGYSTADFPSAVRGLLAEQLVEHGITAARVNEIIDSVLRREETGSTCSGPIALPHARVSGLGSIVAGVGVNPSGVYPKGETRVMLAFVSPAEAAGEHLRFLSLVAKTLRDGGLVQRVLGAGSTDELLALLTNSESPSR
jgi:PTS system nitrogen regulatory IIA component